MRPVELDLDAIPRRARKPAEPKPHRKVAAWRRIIASLRYDGPQTISALAKGLKIAEPTIRYCTNIWLRRGIVEKVGRKYKLTEKYPDYGKPKARKPPAPRPKKPTAWAKLDTDD